MPTHSDWWLCGLFTITYTDHNLKMRGGDELGPCYNIEITSKRLQVEQTSVNQMTKSINQPIKTFITRKMSIQQIGNGWKILCIEGYCTWKTRKSQNCGFKLWLHVQFLQASLLNCLQFLHSAARIACNSFAHVTTSLGETRRAQDVKCSPTGNPPTTSY